MHDRIPDTIRISMTGLRLILLFDFFIAAKAASMPVERLRL
jgi:hypothetical protein